MCMMLHRYEADVNLTNSRGQSALHLAAKAGLSDVLHWLSAKASPSLRQARDSAGLRAADVAKAQGLTPPLLAKLETGAGAGASSRAAVPETKRSGLKTR
ncbi:CYTB5-A [Symbiodinium pilosum]|uniref:CYTB5-A protein n=1 Tax=Symbiodinium pilosum TaxID=2952 RepID=A0A812MCG3_SYMPI|nr:CYTB5-A [Symbiodinium pilosum]